MDAGKPLQYPCAMNVRSLVREWAALLAIFAMALGPLALSVSRSLAAQERVAVAAGLASLPMCQPGETMDGMAGKTAHACDHCLPAHPAAPACPSVAVAPLSFVERLQPADTGPSSLLEQLRLPPATGPPTA